MRIAAAGRSPLCWATRSFFTEGTFMTAADALQCQPWRRSGLNACSCDRRGRATSMTPFSVLSSVEATIYWFEPPHSRIAQSKAWLASMVGIAGETGEDFVVEHEGRVIGKMGFHAFPVIG